MTSKDGMEYKYDAWGRLASVKAVGGSVLAQYTHDALGRRAVEKYPGVFTTHVYFTPDWRAVEERTDATTHLTVLGATGQIILRDVYSGGAPNEDWRYYARQNANGDIVALIKGAAPNAGRVLERYAYEPYGSMLVMAGDGTPRPSGTAYSWRVFFQGGRVDNLSGLYNFQRRDYDPSSGTWMTRDPIGLLSGDPNPYRFVANNPVNLVDPSGLAPPIRGPVAAPRGGYDASRMIGGVPEEDLIPRGPLTPISFPRAKFPVRISIGITPGFRKAPSDPTWVADRWNSLGCDQSLSINPYQPDWPSYMKWLDNLGSNIEIVDLIISGHGSAGSVRPFNHQNLNDTNSDTYKFIQALAKRMKKGGTITIKACNVMRNELGDAFTQRLAEITEADVKAYTDWYAITPHGDEITTRPNGGREVTAQYPHYKGSWLHWLKNLW